MSEFNDPFATEDKFAQMDLSSPNNLIDQLSPIVDEHPELAPTPEEVIQADGAPAPVVVPVPVVAVPDPEVHEYPDGSTVSLEKTNKGWCATLDSGGKAPEKFYGRTKDDLLTNVLAAKLHASQHIRDLSKKIKLTARPEPQVSPQPQAQPRQLTQAEIEEVKTQLATNPDLAFSNWFQKKTGLNPEELVSLVEQGRFAREELDSEGVAKAFMAAHPEYYPDPEFKNYLAIVGYLSKVKLRQTLDESSRDSVNNTMRQLIRGGYWTVEDLEEAYEELSEDGLLETVPDVQDDEEEITPPPAAPQPVPVVPVAPAKPAAPTSTPDPRIAARRVGQRAGLGIRESQVSRPPQETQRPPSDDELENLTDKELQELFSGVRRAASPSRRR
jgi:hypothetical protein